VQRYFLAQPAFMTNAIAVTDLQHPDHQFGIDRGAALAGSYAVAGAGGAVATGAGGVQLQNGNGVILQLSGPKVGAEVSAAVGGVTITMQ
jgi:hypothetical protein